MDINNGSVGDLSWHSSGRKGVQPGYYKNDMNVDFPDVEAPFDGGYMTPGPGTNDGIGYKYLLGSGNYQLDGLSLSGSETLYVTGDSVLYVTADIDISGTASIVVASNATLQMYVSGVSASIGGNGVVNETGNATNFAYLGMTNNTSLSFSGNGDFVGVIYAPNADFTLGGGGATVTMISRRQCHPHSHNERTLSNSTTMKPSAKSAPSAATSSPRGTNWVRMT